MKTPRTKPVVKRRLVLMRDGHNYHCHYCGHAGSRRGQPQERLTIDHVVPLSAGGDDAPHNMVLACHLCNAFKGSYMPDDPIWLRLREMIRLGMPKHLIKQEHNVLRSRRGQEEEQRRLDAFHAKKIIITKNMHVPLTTSQLIALGGAFAKNQSVLIITPEDPSVLFFSLCELLHKYGIKPIEANREIVLSTSSVVHVRSVSECEVQRLTTALVMLVSPSV